MEREMQFDQQFNEGDFRIYVAASDTGRGRGYTAAVVVSRVRGAMNTPCEVYRDTCLAGGHRWISRNAALSYAASVGREIAHTEPSRLAHC
ncbi:hypothetical protein ASE08_05805 [Rhizobacter sp. Root16D2]|nr:hypothetical protein ASC88_10405 [Rhizobacter sp. Root29]KQV97871.1 hypothetical protein ASC98_11245 [Rhizobacter sp. Root1238]KRB18742.1 hypothetical protein ASE08_05805 [Rhizobacter sp. Root16D2]